MNSGLGNREAGLSVSFAPIERSVNFEHRFMPRALAHPRQWLAPAARRFSSNRLEGDVIRFQLLGKAGSFFVSPGGAETTYHGRET
jgi:hypothetical protein